MPFDNTKGFVPKGSLLYYWTLLPQSSTLLNGKKIPSLFGILKGIGFYYAFVIGLIAAEFYLIFFALPNDGVPTITLLIFSLLDFAVGVLPLFFEKNPDRNLPILKAEKFIIETNLNPNTPKDIPEESKESFLRNEEIRLQSINNKILWVKVGKFLLATFIIVFAYVKFITYVDHYGGFKNFIFDTIGSGRLLFYVIVGGAFVHILFTKTFIYHIIYWLKLQNQRREFVLSHRTDFVESQKNKDKLFEYKVSVVAKSDNNQKILQRVDENEVGSNIVSLLCNGINKKFRTDNFVLENRNIHIVYSGLLLDTEVNKLFSEQPDNDISRAVVAACKKQQISQIAN